MTVQKDTPFQLPAGTWTVLRPREEPVTLEVKVSGEDLQNPRARDLADRGVGSLSAGT